MDAALQRTAAVDVVERARRDAVAFVDFVAQDEDGNRARCAAEHRRWHALWTDHAQSVLFGWAGAGKSLQVRYRIIWELGRNPNLRVAYVSATDALPLRQLAAIRTEIETNPRVHRVFPHLRAGALWTSEAFTVQRTSTEPTASLTAFGLGTEVASQRFGLIVLDDVSALQTTWTDAARERAWAYCSRTLLPRLSRTGRAWCLANTWHSEDVPHRLVGTGWAQHRTPVVAANGRPTVPELVTAAWAERRARQLGPMAADAMLHLRLPMLGQRIRGEWIERALQAGRGVGYATERPGWQFGCVTGVDVSTGTSRDKSVLLTLARMPVRGLRVLKIASGHWLMDETVARIRDTTHQFGGALAIESNGIGEMLCQRIDSLETGPKVKRHLTTRERKIVAMEKLALLFADGDVVLPATADGDPLDDEVRALIEGLLSYGGGDQHMPDHVAALMVAVEALDTTTGWAGFDSLEDMMDADSMYGGRGSLTPLGVYGGIRG